MLLRLLRLRSLLTCMVQNIAKAQAEIDRLESKDSASPGSASDTRATARKPTNANESTNGIASATAEHPEEKDATEGKDATEEKDAAADVSENLKKVTLDDEQAPESEPKDDGATNHDEAAEEDPKDEKTESSE